MEVVQLPWVGIAGVSIETVVLETAVAPQPVSRHPRSRKMRQAKRAVKIVFGFTLLVAGVVMILTPGPGWVTIFAGLAVLAAEYIWARRLLDRLKGHAARLRNSVRPAGSPEKT